MQNKMSTQNKNLARLIKRALEKLQRETFISQCRNNNIQELMILINNEKSQH